MAVDRKVWKEAAQALGFRALGVCSGARCRARLGWGHGREWRRDSRNLRPVGS